ncbi:DUF2330 domain-containing protein [Streptomyces sp. NPDC050418]|uniref:DUF2330 domain-containing protein n=1 Tax=Streptomyces sp. NPDC050418 TaxID=3365612 RepID=UPI003793982A
MRYGVGRRPGVTTRARRLVAVLLALAALQLGSLISPAYACGCGAMVTGEDTRVIVSREVSAVRWDGRQEEIAMRLSVQGTAHEAAWIMPVPARADVELGDRALFSELTGLTAPVRKERTYFWPRAGDFPFSPSRAGRTGDSSAGGAPSVEVTGREQLGPFDVAHLSASDPDALADWLDGEGFRLSDRLGQALRPYVDQGWQYVAIRLAPEKLGGPLRGQLEPLRISFPSDRLVYPMRLSHLAAQPQALDLYVLAAHRMEPRTTIGGERPKVTYAGRLGKDSGPAVNAFAEGGTRYLTAITQTFPEPSDISGDHELRRTDSDAPYQQVIYDDELLLWAGIPAWMVTVGGALATALALLAWRAMARSRRPVTPPPAVWTPPPLN